MSRFHPPSAVPFAADFAIYHALSAARSSVSKGAIGTR